MSDLSLLPSGQTLSVEPGKSSKSYIVKTGEDTWLVANFHQAGKMTGPLIYAEIEAESLQETFKKSKAAKEAVIDKSHDDIGMLLFLISTGGLFFFLLLSSIAAIPAPDFGFPSLETVEGIVFFMLGVPTMMLFYRIMFPDSKTNDVDAYLALCKAEGKVSKTIPFPSSEYHFLKERSSSE
jgi:hypothetical protein